MNRELGFKGRREVGPAAIRLVFSSSPKLELPTTRSDFQIMRSFVGQNIERKSYDTAIKYMGLTLSGQLRVLDSARLPAKKFEACGNAADLVEDAATILHRAQKIAIHGSFRKAEKLLIRLDALMEYSQAVLSVMERKLEPMLENPILSNSASQAISELQSGISFCEKLRTEISALLPLFKSKAEEKRMARQPHGL